MHPSIQQPILLSVSSRFNSLGNNKPTCYDFERHDHGTNRVFVNYFPIELKFRNLFNNCLLTKLCSIKRASKQRWKGDFQWHQYVASSELETITYNQSDIAGFDFGCSTDVSI